MVEYQTFDEFLARHSDVGDVEGAVDLPMDKNPSIEFANVSFSYGDKMILNDVSFKVDGGDTLGLVGSSGCGKSTILRLLLRFYKQSSGTIYINGQDITQVTAVSLRRLFSVVTQDALLFNGTIRENIVYGKMGTDDTSVLAAAKLAELALSAETASDADSQNSGSNSDLSLDKPCGEKGAKLSGGQQQRVSLARAMLKNGTIYLLDEPTTGLDGVVAKQLQTTLDELSTQATTLMVRDCCQCVGANTVVHLECGYGGKGFACVYMCVGGGGGGAELGCTRERERERERESKRERASERGGMHMPASEPEIPPASAAAHSISPQFRGSNILQVCFSK